SRRRGGLAGAVRLPDSTRAALAPWLARTPRRVGYAREPLRRALLSEALPPPREGGRRVALPMTERYLRITRRLGCADRGDRLELAADAGAGGAPARGPAPPGGGRRPRPLGAPGAAPRPAKSGPPAPLGAGGRAPPR